MEPRRRGAGTDRRVDFGGAGAPGARRAPVGESLADCAECGEAIPEARRKALPGVKICIDCQQERDQTFKVSPGFNRRGSKDSQLK